LAEAHGASIGGEIEALAVVMSSKGAITVAIQHVRTSLEAVLAPYKWPLLTAENPFQKWNILAATRRTGYGIVSWKSDAAVSQAGRSLVVKARIAVTLCSRSDLSAPAIGKIVQQADGTTPALFEIHDRVKGAMLAMSMPVNLVPEPGAEMPLYGGSVPLSMPDGMPLDGIEQTWEIELVESFSPENTE
jgi:hypothetical protein